MRWARAVLIALLLAGCSGSGPPALTPLPSPWPSPADLVTIQAQIEARAGTQLRSVGQGQGRVEVGLGAGGAALAAELLAAYGPAVHITVGLFEYPDRKPSTVGDGACKPAWTIIERSDVRAWLDVPAPRIVSGDTFRATVRIEATGPQAVTVETGEPLLVYLFKPGSTAPIGVYDGGIAGVGRTFELTPGHPGTVNAGGGTASCDASLGYALPPGSYEARALVEDGHPDDSHSFWSEPATIEVVAS